ncbi:MAG TPA: FKBP-type peptidyl-prolyl cis-trans isomerase [Candidatus Polarisedimenticolia bacterium]|nr:FKBP-type peptidyl-prolyl cis-trans isomerase [Candidatus Polarisedimenticolia bacterium]
MRRVFPVAILVPLAILACSKGAAPNLGTDDQKTLYAVGLVMSDNLASLNLTEAELTIVKEGLTDGALKHERKVDLNVYGPKIRDLATARAKIGSESERAAGQAFLAKAAAEKGAVKTPSGLIIQEISAGSGASPTPADKVKVHYKGTLIDGTVFDSSIDRGEPAVFPLSGIIPCWAQGLQAMKVGGKSRLICPSELAYGDRGAPPKIKPGATLVFEVELLGIEK